MGGPAGGIVAAIESFRRGDMVVVTDDADRENEGDLVMAAAAATPEKLGFMIRYTSGIICAPLPQEYAARLGLEPMVRDNTAPLSTAFTVSVDHAEGLRTGISAEERCNTVRALADPNANPRAFVRPGHVFPLIAREGGVLIRSGHTEAAVDLAELAGHTPVGVIGELVNDSGTVMRGEEVLQFARWHGLTLVSIAELIAYRQQRERLVTRVGEREIATAHGTARGVAYATPFDAVQHLALVFGEIGDGQDVLVRLHREDLLSDVFPTGPRALDGAIERIARAGRGALIYLRDGATGVAPTGQIAGPVGPGEGKDSEALRRALWREVGVGAQILNDLAIRSIRLIASQERQYVGLSGFGIDIVSTELTGGASGAADAGAA